jgi:hypothetical protein
LFFAAVAGSAIFIFASSRALPERVASHFAAGGQANGWMPRESYVAFMLAIAVVVPVLLVALLAWLPRALPGLVNLPNRAYWLAAERRDETLASLSSFAWAFGAMLAALLAGVHWTVVAANERVPPHLSETALIALLLAFAVALGAWLACWWLRFRRPR